MNNQLSLDSIYNIKEQLDVILSEQESINLKSGDDERKVFKIINELFIIKACIDTEIIYIANNEKIDLDKLMGQLQNINPVFNELFKLGSPYGYDFPKEFINKIIDLIFAYNYRNIDFDFIGKLFQFYINKDDKKKYGQFYTPESIIDEILDDININESNPQILSSRFMDPACGTGSFLTRIANRLIKIANRSSLSVEGTIEIVSNCIFGFDIKDFSIYVAKSNLLVQVLSLIKVKHDIKIKFNLYITDSLKNLTSDIECIEDKEIIDIKRSSGDHNQLFDYIVGNPPYFKAKNISSQQKVYFKDILKGQQNTYGLFLYLCIRLLKVGGRLGVIIPESIKSGLYFQALRKYIFERCTITHIVSFDCRKTNFYDALQGVMIICLTNTPNIAKSGVIQIKNVTNEDFLRNKAFNNKIFVKYKDVVRKIKEYELLIVCSNKKYYTLINRVYRNCLFLEDSKVGYKVHTGQLVWNQVKDYLVDEPSSNTRPLVWANNIEQYKYYLNGNKDGKLRFVVKEGKLSKRTNTGECILIKRISTKEQNCRLNASYFNNKDEYFIENHINYIKKHGNDTKISYNYILALLNSELMNIIMSQIACNTQISVTEMNLLPLKFNNDMERIDELVDEILRGNGDLNNLKESINRLINNAYGL